MRWRASRSRHGRRATSHDRGRGVHGRHRRRHDLHRAAIRREGKAEVVTLGDRGDVIPSIAFLREDDVLLVGHAAERRAVSDATRVARAFKRRIGDDVPLSLGGRAHTAEALTAAIVRWVVDLVAAREGGMPGRTVLTLPAGWRDHRRDLLLGAAAEAGVPEPELLAEPVAAAIHYSDRHTLPRGDRRHLRPGRGHVRRDDRPAGRRGVRDRRPAPGRRPPRRDRPRRPRLGPRRSRRRRPHAAPRRRPVAGPAAGAGPGAGGGRRRQGGAVVRHAGGRPGDPARVDDRGQDHADRVRGDGPPGAPPNRRRVQPDLRGRAPRPDRPPCRAPGGRVEPHPDDRPAHRPRARRPRRLRRPPQAGHLPRRRKCGQHRRVGTGRGDATSAATGRRGRPRRGRAPSPRPTAPSPRAGARSPRPTAGRRATAAAGAAPSVSPRS